MEDLIRDKHCRPMSLSEDDHGTLEAGLYRCLENLRYTYLSIWNERIVI